MRLRDCSRCGRAIPDADMLPTMVCMEQEPGEDWEPVGLVCPGCQNDQDRAEMELTSAVAPIMLTADDRFVEVPAVATDEE